MKIRLEKFMKLLHPDAIEFLSRKISAFSSDIRKTLHIARVALQLAKTEFLNSLATNNQEIVENVG